MTITPAEWQRRFYVGPSIWATFYRDAAGVEELGDAYETKAAAECEVERHRRQGHRGRRVPVIREVHIHTLALAEDRWGARAAPDIAAPR